MEDAQSPLIPGAAPAFRFVEEFYQFRNLSRDRVRVLLTLDTSSVDRFAPGINRTDGDFPLAWRRSYGQGRVFYNAFGHFPDSFRLAPVRSVLWKALLWLTGELPADATPRSGPSAAPPAPLFSARPDRLLVQLPAGLAPGQPASLVVSSVNLSATAVPFACRSGRSGDPCRISRRGRVSALSYGPGRYGRACA